MGSIEIRSRGGGGGEEEAKCSIPLCQAQVTCHNLCKWIPCYIRLVTISGMRGGGGCNLHGVVMPPPPSSETQQYYSSLYIYSRYSGVASSEPINLVHVSVTELWMV